MDHVEKHKAQWTMGSHPVRLTSHYSSVIHHNVYYIHHTSHAYVIQCHHTVPPRL
eukprot:COSAG06_NODE_28210_length_578_cov_1.701461_1_plen_54_part_10